MSLKKALSVFGWRRPGLANTALLGLPALWFAGLYLAAIGALLVTSFWTVDDLSGNLIPGFSFVNFQQLLSVPVLGSTRTGTDLSFPFD